MKKALITGITGQDGSYLAEHLLAQGYEVHGLIRPDSGSEGDLSFWRIQPFRDKLFLHAAALDDYHGLEGVVRTIQPDECYHLAAETFVFNSLEDESHILRVNTQSTHHLLMALKTHAPEGRFFFAGSAEMFGKVSESPQDESTPFNPRSIYGVSKVIGHDLVRYYRDHLGLFACTGVLYNHESPRRGSRFVTRKITSTAAKIKLGMETEIHLGNIDAERDWGYAGDTVTAMHAMLRADNPDHYVIATGITHSVREFLELAFGELDLSYEDYLVIDQNFYRAKEEIPLVGNADKIRSQLDWTPRMSFQNMVREMVKSDLEYFQSLLQ
ncbi:MAG: GDP-mannose 4,6-dehydratase [Nitrospinota bacterium]|nr:GDP-mannose 4,6-dehydratase [Nitrospinota bacterium]